MWRANFFASLTIRILSNLRNCSRYINHVRYSNVKICLILYHITIKNMQYIIWYVKKLPETSSKVSKRLNAIFKNLVRTRRYLEEILSTRLRDFDLDFYHRLLSWLLTTWYLISLRIHPKAILSAITWWLKFYKIEDFFDMSQKQKYQV